MPETQFMVHHARVSAQNFTMKFRKPTVSLEHGEATHTVNPKSTEEPREKRQEMRGATAPAV
eukprot:2626602-Heterocapsa_arctica.AAC.1